MTTATMLPDLHWIMNRMWYYLRLCPGSTYNANKRWALRDACFDWRHRQQPEQKLSPREVELASLEAKDFTTWEDRDGMAALRKAIAQEQEEPDLAAKRDVIQREPCVVTFIKADGSLRVMRTEPCKLVTKESSTKTGLRATKTRKARDPHLLPVWDVEADASRSVNLATVQRIETPTHVHGF